MTVQMIVQGDACEKRYVGAQKGDSTDVESDKTYGDFNLVGSKSNESRVVYDNLPGSEIDVGMGVNLSGKPLGAEVFSQGNKEEPMDVNVMKSDKYSSPNANAQEDACGMRSMRILGEVDREIESDSTCDDESLPKSKSSKHESDYHNGSKRENIKGLDADLSGTSGAEILPQRSKEESTDVESDKTNGDDYLAKRKSSESIVDYDYGPERENGKGMDVDLSGTLSDSEILPQKSKEESTDLESDKTNDGNLGKSKSSESRVDYDNEQESENVEAMDIDLSGTLSGSEIIPQKSKEESTDDKIYDDDNNAKNRSTESRVDCEQETENVEGMDVHLGGTLSDSEIHPHNGNEESTDADNDNVAKSKATVSRVGFDNGPESENGEGMEVDLSGVLLGAEILPQETEEESKDVESDKTYDDGNLSKSKSIECRVGYDNGPESENVEGMDVDLSGTLSGSEILSQRNKEETMSVNVIGSNKGVRPFDNEANVQSPGENPDDNVKIALQSSTWRVPEKTCTSLHSENYNAAPVSIISAIDGGLKETEQPSVKEIQPSINFIDGEDITSTNSVGEEVRSFNSFEKPVKEVKDFAKNLDAAESSLTCKLKTNPLVLCDTKVLQQESSGLLVDDTQEASVALANEINSTIISLLGDANAESKPKSDESLAKEKDLKLCISESQIERNSGLLCIDEKNILEKGNLPNEVNEIKATIVSQIDDTNDVRSDKSGLKLIAQKDLEHGTTDLKPDLVLAAKIPSNCGTIYSSLQKDVSMPITSITSFPLGKGSSDFPLTCPKGKDEILSTKSVIDNNANRKRSRNPEAHATTEYENTEGTSVVDPTINPVESMHSARNSLLSVLALRETKPSEASLRFLLHKKNELCHQLQEIQDQIALCDQHIQKISDAPGNKDSVVLKVDTMINCCLDFLKTATEVQCNSYNETGGYGAIQLRRPETTLEPFLSIGSERQESDDSNLNICAPADQLMSSSNGNFHPRVGAGEVDFKCTREGVAGSPVLPKWSQSVLL